MENAQKLFYKSKTITDILKTKKILQAEVDYLALDIRRSYEKVHYHTAGRNTLTAGSVVPSRKFKLHS